MIGQRPEYLKSSSNVKATIELKTKYPNYDNLQETLVHSYMTTQLHRFDICSMGAQSELMTNKLIIHSVINFHRTSRMRHIQLIGTEMIE